MLPEPSGVPLVQAVQPGRRGVAMVRRRSTVRFRKGAPGGLHIWPVSMFTFGTDTRLRARMILGLPARGAESPGPAGWRERWPTPGTPSRNAVGPARLTCGQARDHRLFPQVTAKCEDLSRSRRFSKHRTGYVTMPGVALAVKSDRCRPRQSAAYAWAWPVSRRRRGPRPLLVAV